MSAIKVNTDGSIDLGIYGSGGGGKGGESSGGVEAGNTLRTNMRARMLELISEGECVGLANGDKSIYLDNTVIRNNNGSLNFRGITVEQRYGLPDQDAFTGNVSASTPHAVDVKVKRDSGEVVRTIAEQNATAALVIIRLPALLASDTRGNINATTVAFKIKVRPNGGSWTTAHDISLTEKCNSPAQLAYRVDLEEGGYPWDIAVERITPDSEEVKLQNETWFESYTSLVENRFTYPNSALIFMEVNASQFDQAQIPKRVYDYIGIKMQVPNNYDPATRTYTGIWDGTFKTAWTDNPAWVFYMFLTNDRFGLGEYIDVTRIDKWGLYEIAQYCDELVPDGFGGQEPRYTFNGQINSRKEAYKLLQEISTVFRGMSYWSLGQVFAFTDKPEDPSVLVTRSNVVNGNINYQNTSQKARHSVCLVTWNDPKDFGRPAVEVVVDDEMLALYGWREVTIQAIGCNSRGLAHRYGKWVLDLEKNATETAEYETGWDHADVRPGQIIALADKRKAETRLGGRIVSASGTAITLDQAFTPAGGETYSLMAVLPDGSTETVSISGFSGADVTLASAYSSDPIPGAVWVITGSDVQPPQYRVLSIVESDKTSFKINALQHDPTKYARIEQNITLDPIPYRRPRNNVSPVTNLYVRENRFIDDGEAKARAIVSWTQPADLSAVSYKIWANTPKGIVEFPNTTIPYLEVERPISGVWTFYVQAVNALGVRSQEVSYNITIEGWGGVDQPYVSHLEVFGQGAEAIFGGKDCVLVWRNNFPGTTYEPAQEPTAGAGLVNPLFRDNLIRIKDANNDILLREEVVSSGDRYTYTFEKNSEDNARFNRPPQRKFRVEVYIRDTVGRLSDPTELLVENPIPDIVIPVLTPAYNSIEVKLITPDDIDYDGFYVWISQDPEFDPLVEEPVYVGKDNLLVLPAQANVAHYVRAAAYDTFSRNNLNISPVVTATPNFVDVDTTPPAVPTNLILTTSLVENPNGEIVSVLVATWDPVVSSNLQHYDLSLTEDGGPTSMVKATNARYEWRGLKFATQYDVQVRSVSKPGYQSSWHAVQSATIPAKTTAPGVPANLSATASVHGFLLEWDAPADKDIAHYEIYEHATADTPGSATLVGTTKGTIFSRTGLPSATLRYFWVKAVNTSGVASAVSNSATGTTVKIDTIDIEDDAIEASQIAPDAVTVDAILAGAVNNTKLASGLTTVEIVSSLPTTGNFQGRQVHYTADDKLYRYDGSGWISVVPASDITGQLTDSQIADIAAAKITGEIITSQLSDAAITAEKLAAGLSGIETVSTLPISNNYEGRIVYLDTDDKIYRYDGAGWTNNVSASDITGQIVTSQIVDDAITTAKIATAAITVTEIADNAVTSPKIIAGAIVADKIDVGAVTTAKIAAGAVTATEIAAEAIITSKIAAGAVTATEIAAGAIITSKIAAGAITATEIAAGAITATEIATGTITASNIAAATIVGSNIAADTITTGLIAAGAITATEIATDAITADKILAGSITAAKIATDAITADKILAGTITASEIAAGAITATEIAAGTITASEIASNAITSDKILANAITAVKIAADQVTTAKIAAGAITATELATNAVTADKILAGVITGEKIYSQTITAANIAVGTITATEISADAITTAKIAAGAITATELATNSVTSDKVAANAIVAGKIAANAVTATEINVATLSAIAANVGTLNAGIIQDNGGGDTLQINLNTGHIKAVDGEFSGKLDAASMASGGTIDLGKTGTILTRGRALEVGEMCRHVHYCVPTLYAGGPSFTSLRYDPSHMWADSYEAYAAALDASTGLPTTPVVLFPGSPAYWIMPDGVIRQTANVTTFPTSSSTPFGQIHPYFWDRSLANQTSWPKKMTLWAQRRDFIIDVPAGATSVTCKLWGGGAGGFHPGTWTGGAGGYVKGTYAVSGGDKLLVRVPFGGNWTDATHSYANHPVYYEYGRIDGWAGAGRGYYYNGFTAAGGGYALVGLLTDNDGNYTTLFVAGGGGAGNNASHGNPGGPAGTGRGGNTGTMAGQDALNAATQNDDGCGGGGGGYEGGLRGNGGTNFAHASATSVTSTAGTGRTPPNIADADYTAFQTMFGGIANKVYPAYGYYPGDVPLGPTMVRPDVYASGGAGLVVLEFDNS